MNIEKEVYKHFCLHKKAKFAESFGLLVKRLEPLGLADYTILIEFTSCWIKNKAIEVTSSMISEAMQKSPEIKDYSFDEQLWLLDDITKLLNIS